MLERNIVSGLLTTFLFSTLVWAKGKIMSSSAEKLNQKTEIAILAGGCFWGVEELFRKEKGILKTEVGYTGGKNSDAEKNAKYEFVKKGNTGHAESIKITFDPNIISYKKLLLFFFKIHDPTTINQQGNDVGSQYRSEIFYTTEEQMRDAKEVIKSIDQSKAWKKPIVTAVTKATDFFSAEDFHQDYLQKNPGGYTCHWERKLDF